MEENRNLKRFPRCFENYSVRPLCNQLLNSFFKKASRMYLLGWGHSLVFEHRVVRRRSSEVLSLLEYFDTPLRPATTLPFQSPTWRACVGG